MGDIIPIDMNTGTMNKDFQKQIFNLVELILYVGYNWIQID
jgi:hypothetical protein